MALRMSQLGESPTKIRQFTGVAPRTQRRISKTFADTGSVVKKPLQNGRPRLLNCLDVNFLEACIEKNCDIALEELQGSLEGVCGVLADVTTISRSLRRRGLVRKEVTRPAREQNEVARLIYQMKIGTTYRARQLVFVDESACDRRTARRKYGWARIGDRARRRDFFIRGKRYSMLPALSLDGIIALEIVEGSIDGDRFSHFIDILLNNMNPWPAPNSVIVMDNASIHKGEEIRQKIEERGMRLEYLPAYSPDLNPIEEAFSSIKAWIRANREFVLEQLNPRYEAGDPIDMIRQAVFSVTAEKAWGWFKHSGYVAN